jgi:hypothetical protein
MQFQSQGKPPVGIVYDSDLGNTIDDALALASLYGFQGKGESRVIGISTSRPGVHSAIFADILVRFYTGDPGPFGGPTPIGLTLGNPPADTPMMAAVLDKPTYVRNIKHMNETADPLAVFRNALSAQFDGNAIVFLSGPATNLAASLALPGVKELVTAKARYMVVALGNYGSNGVADPQVKADLAAARKLFEEWPTPIVAAGVELNSILSFPAAALEKDFAWAPEHPLVDAYRAALAGPADAPAAALAAVLYAVRPNDSFFKLSEPGAISVGDDGRTRLTPASGGKHRFLIADPAKQEQVRQLFVETASTKPVPRAPRFRPQQKKQ